jgi:hypothetical protein
MRAVMGADGVMVLEEMKGRRGDISDFLKMPSRSLPHQTRMEILREKNAEAEFYVWCGIGLLLLVTAVGAFFGRNRY